MPCTLPAPTILYRTAGPSTARSRATSFSVPYAKSSTRAPPLECGGLPPLWGGRCGDGVKRRAAWPSSLSIPHDVEKILEPVEAQIRIAPLLLADRRRRPIRIIVPGKQHG